MTINKNNYNLRIFAIVTFTMFVMAFSGFNLVPVSDYIFIDLLMIPIIFIVIGTNKFYSILGGLVWGILTIFAPNYIGEYYPIWVAIIPRTITSFGAHLFFLKISNKRNFSVTKKLISTIVLANLLLFVNEFAIASLFSIYYYKYAYTLKQIYKGYLFDLFFKKILIQTIYMIILDLVIKSKIMLYFNKGDIKDVRFRKKDCEYYIDEECIHNGFCFKNDCKHYK